WIPALIFVEKVLLGVGLLFFITVSMISPPSSNRALPVRLYLIGAWLFELVVSLIVIELVLRWSPGFIDLEEAVIAVWVVVYVVVFSAGVFVASCERDTWTPRVLRHVPRLGLGRAAMFLLTTGSAGGVLWAV